MKSLLLSPDLLLIRYYLCAYGTGEQHLDHTSFTGSLLVLRFISLAVCCWLGFWL